MSAGKCKAARVLFFPFHQVWRGRHEESDVQGRSYNRGPLERTLSEKLREEVRFRDILRALVGSEVDHCQFGGHSSRHQ